jgi:peptide/nickel transport system permease protein
VIGRSPWQLAWLRLRRDRWALTGGIVVLLFLLIAIGAPVLAAIEGQDPYTYHIELLDPVQANAPRGAFGGVSASHWFGVEPLTGRDMFAIVVYGARTSFLIGLAAAATSVFIGAVAGLVAGLAGGFVDTMIGRIMDVVFSFPALIFMIALTVIAPPWLPAPVLLIAVIGFFGWPTVGRVVRSQVLSLARREFIDAARTLGARPTRIMARELLPNVAAPIIVYATILIPSMIGTEAALSYLGVGIPPPTPDWGRSISEAVQWVQVDPWFLAFPAGALFVVVLASNLLGDGIRDALDTRLGRL